MTTTRSTNRPRIAVFSGPTATVQNSPPLITSNKARDRYGLPLLENTDGTPSRFDVLRPQRLAAPVTVYVEQFSAHPLERDAADLYGPPDGYVDAEGVFSKEANSASDKPVYEVALHPSDGLYPLPYMARQADLSAWDSTSVTEGAPIEQMRQTFYPDASRMFEEVDRLGVRKGSGRGNLLTELADFDFVRAAPSGGYTKGLPLSDRTDVGDGDLLPEVCGEDFFLYEPSAVRHDPHRGVLARLTNIVSHTLAGVEYMGAMWLEGSPRIEETIYWLSLLIDTPVPIVGVPSQRPHGAIGNDGDRNLVSAVEYLVSRVWTGHDGHDSVGGVLIADERVFTARDVQKADARPGGYVVTGGIGGVVGRIGEPGPPTLLFRPTKKHTHNSDVALTRLPGSVPGVRACNGHLDEIDVELKGADGRLLESAVPTVSIVKYGSYTGPPSADESVSEVEIIARTNENLVSAPLAGFITEAYAPYGTVSRSMEAALRSAICQGMPVVKVGRGNAEGAVPPDPDGLFILGGNLTATKARMLLLAALMKLGSLPPTIDPSSPTQEEISRLRTKVAAYQAIFESH